MSSMRYALVGCAVIAPTHVRALRELAGRAELVVCSDVVPERAEALAAEFALRAAPYEDVLADTTRPADAWGQAQRAHLLDFVDAAEQGRRPLVDGTEGRNVVELVRAIDESARTGAPVTL